MESLAAVDLGSNSFHMVIARVDHGSIQIVDRLREPVRLAMGLQEDGSLDEASQERAIKCLTLFGQRLRDFGAEQVRAVGTNALRRARNSRSVLRRAREALGHRIDIIPGREEARLIYLGVSHGIAGAPARRIVVDIGGGIMTCAAVFQLFDALGITYDGALRGAGDTFIPAVFMVASTWVVLIGVAWWIVGAYPELGSLGPWLAATALIAITAIFLWWRWHSRAWMKINVFAGTPESEEVEPVV